MSNPSLRFSLAVALGSGLGGVTRLLIAGAAPTLSGDSMPSGILMANLLGCLVIGLLASITAGHSRWSVSPMWKQFWLAGFCGGFTTFSFFSLETLWLLQHHGLWSGLSYSLQTVIGSVAAVALGWLLGRRISKIAPESVTHETPPARGSD